MNELLRLQKFLAQSGLASRRKSEEFIKSGQISVNGVVITKLGLKINPQKDEIKYQDQIISGQENHVYYLLNKPAGYTTTCSDLHALNTVTELVPSQPRVFPVGRLDKDTTGLLILTNDGDLADKLTHPRYEHQKEYQVTIKNYNKKPTDIKKQLQQLEQGIELEDGPTSPAKINNLDIKNDIAIFNLTIHEGRKHQVKRMCQAVNLKIIKLHRLKMGKISLGNLPIGQYKITKKEKIV